MATTAITLTGDEAPLVRGVFIRNVLHGTAETFVGAIDGGEYHEPDVEAVDREWANLVEVMEADAAITAGGEVTLDDAVWDAIVPEGRDYLISTKLPEGPGTDESVREGVDQLQRWMSIHDKLKAARSEEAAATESPTDEPEVDATQQIVLDDAAAEVFSERVAGDVGGGNLNVGDGPVIDLAWAFDQGKRTIDPDPDRLPVLVAWLKRHLGHLAQFDTGNIGTITADPGEGDDLDGWQFEVEKDSLRWIGETATDRCALARVLYAVRHAQIGGGA